MPNSSIMAMATNRPDISIPYSAPHVITYLGNGTINYIDWTWQGKTFREQWNYNGGGAFIGAGIPTEVGG